MRLLCLRLPSNKTPPPNQHCFISSCLSLFFTLVVLLIDASSLAEQLALGCTTLDSYRAGLAHRGGIVLIRKGSITQHWSSAGESRFTFLCWICLCLVVSFRGLCGLHGVKSLVAVSVNRGYSLSAGTRCAPSRTRSKPTPPAIGPPQPWLGDKSLVATRLYSRLHFAPTHTRIPAPFAPRPSLPRRSYQLLPTSLCPRAIRVISAELISVATDSPSPQPLSIPHHCACYWKRPCPLSFAQHVTLRPHRFYSSITHHPYPSIVARFYPPAINIILPTILDPRCAHARSRRDGCGVRRPGRRARG
jgi:hypothetical protein